MMDWHPIAEAREWALLIFAAVQIGAVILGWLITRTLVTHEQLRERIEPLAEKIGGVDRRVAAVEHTLGANPNWDEVNSVKNSIKILSDKTTAEIGRVEVRTSRIESDVSGIRAGVEGLHSSQEQTRQDIRSDNAQLRDDLRVIQEHLLAAKG